MKELILLLSNIVNKIHETLLSITSSLGLGLSDKDLHLWVFGIIGILSFFVVQLIFKQLAKYSITVISFIYTFTVLIVIVFAIEIQQKITGSGQMDFLDAVVGLWGFLIFFFVYLLFRICIFYINKLLNRTISNKNNTHSGSTRYKG